MIITNSNIYSYNPTIKRQNNMPFKRLLEDDSTKYLNIKARGAFPANVLSNFSNTNFTFDGVRIKSMEGFLQSLKIEDPQQQAAICQLSGFDAKKASKSFKRNKNDVMLFWEGKTFRKDSPEFKKLLNSVLKAKTTSKSDSAFEFAGKKIESVNAFLLALKEQNPIQQKQILQLPQDKLKEAAQKVKLVYDERVLYWQGKKISRNSQEYKNLLKRIFSARFNNDINFRNALRAAKNYMLVHTIGKTSTSDTILTEKEFVGLLKEMQGKDNFLIRAKDFVLTKILKLIKLLKRI